MTSIRAANEDDIAAIAEIHVLAWHAAYSALVSPEILAGVTTESRTTIWNEWFKAKDQFVFVSETSERIRGFIRIASPQDRMSPPPGYGELTHLYLNPNDTSTGLGHELFEFARATIKAQGRDGMLLWTLEGNERARKFYESHDMIHDGARDDQPEWLGEGIYEVRYVYTYPD